MAIELLAPPEFSCATCNSMLDWEHSPICRSCAACNCPQCSVPLPRHPECIAPGWCECPNCRMDGEYVEESEYIEYPDEETA